MNTKQLNNPARALVLIIALLILTIVSAKADMIPTTYSPYNCTLPNNNEKETKIHVMVKYTLTSLSELNMRKPTFKNHPEAKKLQEEVRRNDVTSFRNKLLLTVKAHDCEYPVYKII